MLFFLLIFMIVCIMCCLKSASIADEEKYSVYQEQTIEYRQPLKEKSNE